ncbi:MAG: winged helix-turn-helix domain-containing protein [Defluviitaleaceae bacterium]|nr:winged helix-turn-helix domain-containing protein [Defluviitaleaceae bacterium]
MSDKKIMELEAQLAHMQQELEKMKQTQDQPPAKPDPFTIYQPQLEKAQAEIQDIFKDMGKNHGTVLASTVVGIAYTRGGFAGNVGTCVCHTVDEIPEEALATALDVFSNPRRITVLKALMRQPLTGSEISQKTGLVGGQLYHHLSILENAGLIHKNGDRYEILDSAQLLLGGLYAAVGGMDMARPAGDDGNTP